jgi:hypothetical protein
MWTLQFYTLHLILLALRARSLVTAIHVIRVNHALSMLEIKARQFL